MAKMDRTKTDWRAWLRVAESAALSAGHHLAVRHADWHGVDAKTGRDIKLKADVLSETLIIDLIAAASEFPILSEETGWRNEDAASAERLWVIDPLDGSANYAQAIPFCAVSIALLEQGRPVVGVVYDFNHNELFSGIVGEGAWLNHAPMHVSAVDAPGHGVLMTGLPVRRDFSSAALSRLAADLGTWRKVRMIGSAALATAYVAAGRADFYREENIMMWDVAAGCALVDAAGGHVEVSPGPLDAPKTVTVHNGRLSPVVDTEMP